MEAITLRPVSSARPSRLPLTSLSHHSVFPCCATLFSLSTLVIVSEPSCHRPGGRENLPLSHARRGARGQGLETAGRGRCVRIIMLCYHSMPRLIDGRGSPDRSDHSRGLIVLPCGCSLSRAAAVCAPGDVMPYFYLQHDDYVALKSRVASAVLAGTPRSPPPARCPPSAVLCVRRWHTQSA